MRGRAHSLGCMSLRFGGRDCAIRHHFDIQPRKTRELKRAQCALAPNLDLGPLSVMVFFSWVAAGFQLQNASAILFLDVAWATSHVRTSGLLPSSLVQVTSVPLVFRDILSPGPVVL